MGAAEQAKTDDSKTCWYGVDLIEGGIRDTYEAGIWEPADNKRHAITAAVEAALGILSIDETVVAPPSQDPGAGQSGMMDSMSGKPMSNLMNNAMDQANSGGARTGNLAPGVSYMKGRGG